MTSIFQDDTLTQGQRLVWFAVRDLATDGVAADNCSKIAGHMDSGRSHVSRALDALECAGWVERQGGVIHLNNDPSKLTDGNEDRASKTRNRASKARNRDSHTRDRDSQARNRDSEARPEDSPQGKKKSSTKEKTQPPLTTASAAPGAGAREEDSAGPFDVEADSVDKITEAAFGEPIRGLTIKDQIRTYCERAGPEGWDCLRSVCSLIAEKPWNPSAQLVKKKLTDQLQLLKESNEADAADDFASKAQRILDAAGKGAGAH